MPLWRMILMAINLAGFRFGGAAIGLASQILLARLLPQHDVGIVLMTMSAAALISLVMTVGYPSLAMTCLPRYYALGRKSLAAAYHSAAWHDTLIVSAAAVASIMLLAVFRPFSDGMTTALVFGCLMAPASSLIRLTSSTANSLRRFSLSYVPDFLFRPAILLVYLAGAWILGHTLPLTSVLWVLVLGTAAVAVVQAFMLGRQGPLPYLFHRSRRRLAPYLRGRAMALVIVAAVAASLADLVTLLGGLFLSSTEVAELGIAVRLAALAGFVTQATQQFVLPDLAKAITRGQRGEVQSLLFRINLIALSAIAAGVAGAIVLGPWVLMIFGAEYANAHWPLVLFMLGQLVRASGGMNQYLLSIDGFQLRTANSCIFAVASLGAAATLLTPGYGVMGMAIAALIADLLWSGILAIQAQRYAGYRGDILAVLRARRKLL